MTWGWLSVIFSFYVRLLVILQLEMDKKDSAEKIIYLDGESLTIEQIIEIASEKYGLFHTFLVN
jgi:hypothetical protein